MSILIPGMKMPKDEKAIHLEIHSDGTVLMWQMGDDDKVVGTAIELPPHGRLGDLDALRRTMYHEAFETDSPMQKWDSGCWIRYKMFERMEEAAPTIIPADPEGGSDGD